MSLAWQFLIAGLGTYFIRLSAIALVGRGATIPSGLGPTLRLIAPSVLAAIIANSLVLDGTAFNRRVSWYAGAIVAVLVVRRLGSAGWAMTLGMAIVWMMQRAGMR